MSVDTNGRLANGDSGDPEISDDGRYVAFTSYATDLVSDGTNQFGAVFIRDRASGATTRVSVDVNGDDAVPESPVGHLTMLKLPDDEFVALTAADWADNQENS